MSYEEISYVRHREINNERVKIETNPQTKKNKNGRPMNHFCV
jgi:hypothetical protein